MRDMTPGSRCTRGHVVECTTVVPATSAYMRKPTTSSGVHDSGVGRPGNRAKKATNRRHVPHFWR